MANIRMNQNSIGKYSFQRSKVPSLPNSGLNGISKELSPRLAPVRYLQSGIHKASEREENKSYLPFAEKLKHLLENGNVTDQYDKEDPYAFPDAELSSLNAPLNGCGSDSIGHYNLPNVGAKNVENFSSHAQRARLSVHPQVSNSKQCLSTVTAHSSAQTSTSVTLLGQSLHQTKNLVRQPSEATKLKNCLPAKQVPFQTPVNNRLNQANVEKLVKNVKVMVTPYNGRQSTGGGKPMNFGKSQMSKLAIAKIEKSMESKHRNGNKAKHLHSPQKSVSISKLLSKTKRPSPIRSVSLDSDLSASRNKLGLKKTVLEEPLIGIKQTDWVASRAVGVSRSTSPPIVQTATTTVPVSLRPVPRAASHKALQRTWDLRNRMKLLKRNYQSFGLLIDDPRDNVTDSCEGHIVQNYWFSLCTDYNSSSGHSRNAKLAQLKTELRHKLQQQQWRYRDEYRDEMAKLLIQTARNKPNLTAFLLRLETSTRFRNKLDRWRGQVEDVRGCGYQEDGQGCCGRPALPHVGFCKAHIARNRNQLLFTSCSAVSPFDNLPCTSPALGRLTDQAFCAFHQRLQMNQRPKKVLADKADGKLILQGKRNKSSHNSSRAGRSRKRKRQAAKEKKESICLISSPKDSESSLMYGGSRVVCSAPNTLVLSKSDVDESQDVEVGEDLPLDSAELASLATQATRLLEEHDFTNVLNHIPADAFNDLFTGDKEEYEPTPQETEELERALEAVDNDVKSLEKLTQNHGILDMLDEQTIAQTLAALPEVVPVLYQNGFGGLGPLEQTLCGLHPDAMNTLPIPPQTDVLQS